VNEFYHVYANIAEADYQTCMFIAESSLISTFVSFIFSALRRMLSEDSHVGSFVEQRRGPSDHLPGPCAVPSIP
jgi:hypothetical protein